MAPAMITSTTAALARLPTLVSGLLLVSEADHPFTVVRLGQLSESELPRALPSAPNGAAEPERVELEAFFARGATAQAYHTESDRLLVERFRALVSFFRCELGNARVYRVGAIEVDVYALGQSLEGEWLGVASRLIET